MKKNHKLSIIVLLFSICSGSNAKELQTAGEVASKCAAMNLQEVNLFESRTGISFENAVNAELRTKGQVALKTQQLLSTFCKSIAGRKYGIANFTSKPKKADIFVDGDPQPEKTNTQLHFPIGEYNWKIKFSDSKECTGYLIVEETKITSIHCDKP